MQGSRRAPASSPAWASGTSSSSTSRLRCGDRRGSIPVNFLHAIPGTPLEGRDDLDARRCLKILALLRFVCPSKEIRVAGGRELNLGSLQPLALFPANAIFIGDYLTTPGQSAEADYRMIEDLGFEIEECAL